MTDVLIVAPFAAQIVARINALGDPMPPGIRIASAESFDRAPTLTEVRAVVTMPQLVDQALLARLPKLEWLQTMTAGIDPLLGLDLGGIAISTMGGVYAAQMSELAFFYMLSFARDVRGVLARQAAAEWRPSPPRLLAGEQVVIVGVGRIAEALARRCQAFEMRVTGVSGSRSTAPGFDRIVATEHLAAVAEGADHLIVLAPYSPQNHHLISRAVLAALPPRAVLINIARGPVVDEAALLEALSEKRIAGAGLDVFTHEPLPAEHPFWTMSNVIVTPHIGGWSTRLVEQMTPLIAGNIGRWFATPRQKLLNQVEPGR
jgi:phosphoglycerate dehydrogenase-like enzyme